MWPCPSDRSTNSPTRIRRTVAACRPSAPSSVMLSVARNRSASTRKTGTLMSSQAPASTTRRACTPPGLQAWGCMRRGRPRGHLQRSLEGVAEPSEEVLALRGDRAVWMLLVAELGQLAQQLLLPGIEPGRGADVEVDE